MQGDASENGATSGPTDGSSEKLSIEEGSDAIKLDYVGVAIQSVEELIASQGVDLSLFYIYKQTSNYYEVTGKVRAGQDENGRWLPDRLWKSANKQIRVELRRKAPKPVQDAIRDLVANWQPPPVVPIVYPSHVSEPCALVFSPSDAHIGKRCWTEFSGSTYDLEIAQEDFRGAIDDMIGEVGHCNFDKVFFTHGGDYFHTDGWKSETTSGTPVDSVDDRFPKVFGGGFNCHIYAIERLRQLAPVEVVHVPGNHDEWTSYLLAYMVADRYRDDASVTVDLSPRLRKYRPYGVSLFGFTHGKCKKTKLPLAMARESQKLWADATYHQIFTGHEHTEKVETEMGVSVISLPSLSGTDKWHDDNLYIGNHREAQAFVYSKANGPKSRHSVFARSARQAPPAPYVVRGSSLERKSKKSLRAA